MKIIFFGSDDFAASHLQHLIDQKFDVVACVTQPDRPKGRGMKMILSPIKEMAIKNNIDVLQPSDIKDENFQSELKSYEAELFIVIAYGRILPQSILDIPKWCAINVHGSLLPKYRGAAPINWAVINGEKQTGLTIIRMTTTLDGGDMLKKHVININENDTAAQIRKQMMTEGPLVLERSIEEIQDHYLDGKNLESLMQDQTQVTYAPKLIKDLGQIDWSKSAKEIHDFVRGLTPWPKAYTFYNGKMLKILETIVSDSLQNSTSEGQVIEINEDGVHVSTGEGVLLIKRVHLESSKPMQISEFLRGYPIDIGHSFV